MTTDTKQQAPISETSNWGPGLIALICGSIIILFSLGIRHGFGLFLKPISFDLGWGVETYAFAIALQNLIWGIAQPLTGYLSDKHGSPIIVTTGAILYALGLWVMADINFITDSFISITSNLGVSVETLQASRQNISQTIFILGAGLLIGLGLSGTTFPVIFGTISRLVKPEQRSLAMGIAMSVGSFGQFIMLPVSLGLLTWLNWQGALMMLSSLALIMFPLAFGLREPNLKPETTPLSQSPIEAIKEAFSMRDFWLLSLGFFACGFQVVFIAVHLPSYLADRNMDASVATTVLALIGLLNIVGTYYAGLWGGRARKPMLLSYLYLLRGLVIAAFILLPISTYTAYAFGVLMGLFWLSTVPLTNGTVASVWDVKHMSMLGGIVFFWHQLGSFIGGWLGGYVYDQTGNYDMVWYLAIGFSLLSALLNWPITETPVAERENRVAT